MKLFCFGQELAWTLKCTFLLILVVGGSSQPGLALDTKRLFSQAKDSVVLIMSFDSNGQPLAIGSGFFVGDGSLIATNFHVIQGASEVRVKLPSGKVLSIKTAVGLDVERDIVVISALYAGQSLKLSHRTPDIGEDIVVMGNPKGLEGTVSSGIISGVRRDKETTYYQITAPISPGSSGGPVIDERGEVLGVSTFYVQGGQNLNFAMPAIYISRLLDKPKAIALTKTTSTKSLTLRKPADERVTVVKPFIHGYIRSHLEASILNNTDNVINNVRMVVAFYEDGTCVHYMLIEVKELVPPHMAVRFKREDEALDYHGQDAVSIGFKRGIWTPRFRILDYDIVEQHGGPSTIPTFQ